MGTSKVSSDFNKFFQRNTRAIEDAKKAENSLQTCAMPVGWKGQCTCTGAVADQSKDRRDEKQNLIPGKPYVRLDFTVVNDERYQGKKFSRIWTLNESARRSTEDALTYMLNDLENMGMPREVRENMTSIQQALDYFSETNTVYNAEVLPDNYPQGDGKRMKVTVPQMVDNTDSVVPGTQASSQELKEGAEVQYLGNTWKIVSITEDGIEIESLKTGNKRMVTEADLKA